MSLVFPEPAEREFSIEELAERWGKTPEEIRQLIFFGPLCAFQNSETGEISFTHKRIRQGLVLLDGGVKP